MYQIAALTGLKRHFRPFVSMFFPILGAHVSGTEFQYPDLSWKEPTGMMAYFIAESGGNKDQLSTLAKAEEYEWHQQRENRTACIGGCALPLDRIKASDGRKHCLHWMVTRLPLGGRKNKPLNGSPILYGNKKIRGKTADSLRGA